MNDNEYIAVVGAGYVGLSLAILLSTKFKVILLDVDKDKVQKINNKETYIADNDISNYLKKEKLNLLATVDKEIAYTNAKYVVIATPTNYEIKTNSFDTRSVEDVINEALLYNKNSNIVIKSTVPMGFTDNMIKKYKSNKIFFSPEFLRENQALYDNLYPSRIIVGSNSKEAIKFGEILSECALKDSNEIQVMKMGSKEAEAVKLFSNTYLALRISFFNELDSFCEVNNLSTEKVIKGVSKDLRIGDYYNNPSFGYGGYCLPKDTQQLLTNYERIPNNIIKSVVSANKTRKEFIVNSILSKSPKVLGVYRLIMKNETDNFRESAVLDIIDMLSKQDIEIILYEPLITEKKFNKISVINDLNEFVSCSDLIIANRMTSELDFARSKIYTRDIFGKN